MANNQQFCLRWNNHQSTLISVFDALLESGTLVDCTLAAEGQYLKAHKVVLSACSPFFEALLSQHYEKHPIVILKDVTFCELKAMLDYMYRGEVNISQDQLGTFLKAAESLQIKGLTDNSSSGNGEIPVKRPSEQLRRLINQPPPRPKSPCFPQGLIIEPRPYKLSNNNNNIVEPSMVRNMIKEEDNMSPKRKKGRASCERDCDSNDLMAAVTPQCTVTEGQVPLKFETNIKVEANENMNNEDSAPEDAPNEDDEDEEMDLSKPGTSQSMNSHHSGLWNVSSDMQSEDSYPVGGLQEQEPVMLHYCDGCGRGYRYTHNLERHKRRECGKEASFTCNLCPYRSKHKHNLVRHVALKHTSNDVKPAAPVALYSWPFSN